MTATSTTRRLRAALLVGLACAVAGGAMVGCRGDRSNKPPRRFFPDMDHQPKYKAQTESSFFDEYLDEETGERCGRAQRLPVAGTVAFGKTPFAGEIMGVDFAQRDEYLRDDDAWAEGRTYQFEESGAPRVNENGQHAFAWVEEMPSVYTPEMIDLGHKKYDIYCLPCHSATGDGKGLVGVRWSYTLPNFHDDTYQRGGAKGQDGYIFHIIRNGVANVGGPYPLKMPAYARNLTLEETWAIVAYIRVLQETRRATPEDLPEAQRLELERRRTGAPTATSSEAMP